MAEVDPAGDTPPFNVTATLDGVDLSATSRVGEQTSAVHQHPPRSPRRNRRSARRALTAALVGFAYGDVPELPQHGTPGSLVRHLTQLRPICDDTPLGEDESVDYSPMMTELRAALVPVEHVPDDDQVVALARSDHGTTRSFARDLLNSRRIWTPVLIDETFALDESYSVEFVDVVYPGDGWADALYGLAAMQGAEWADRRLTELLVSRVERLRRPSSQGEHVDESASNGHEAQHVDAVLYVLGHGSAHLPGIRSDWLVAVADDPHASRELQIAALEALARRQDPRACARLVARFPTSEDTSTSREKDAKRLLMSLRRIGTDKARAAASPCLVHSDEKIRTLAIRFGVARGEPEALALIEQHETEAGPALLDASPEVFLEHISWGLCHTRLTSFSAQSERALEERLMSLPTGRRCQLLGDAAMTHNNTYDDCWSLLNNVGGLGPRILDACEPGVVHALRRAVDTAYDRC